MKIFLFLLLALTAPVRGSLSNTYIAQAAAGAGTGVDCANARALLFFNTGTNWGAGAAQIGPGTTVHLCGTVTSANNTTALTFQGNGTSGNPITLLFEPGAILRSGFFAQSNNGSGCGGGISICSRSFVTIDGGSNGIIRNTDNGSVLGNHHLSTGIDAWFCANCTVKNLSILDIYVHSNNEEGIDETQMRAIAMSGSHWLVQNNIISNCGWCVSDSYQNDDDIQIRGNDFSFMGHGIMFAAAAAVNATNLIIDGNKFHDTANWTAGVSPACPYHQDGIHFFGLASSSMDQLTISNNYFYGDWGRCPTGFIFTEASGAGTPAQAKNYKVFNNVGIISLDSVPNGNTNGWFNFSSGISGSQYIVNNVMIGPSASNNTACFVMQNLSGLTFRDNVITNCGSPARIDASTIINVNNNAYGTSCQNGGNCFVFNNAFTGSFAGWKAACGCDGASIQNNALLLNADGSPQTTSPVRGLGANLSTLATGAAASLQSDTTKGTTRTALARPTGATAWDSGAYQFSAAPPPTTWSLTTSAGTGGTVAPAGTGTYSDGQVVTVTATPNSGKVFSSWTGSATGSTNPLSVTMTADKNITANFVNAASTVSITSVEVSSTQVTFVYTAPAGVACLWRVNESATPAVWVNDVDTNKFPGSSSDQNRASSTINSTATSRTITIGKRTSARGADGRLHSLSLQNNTAHDYSVGCGSAPISGTFTTTTYGEGTGYEHVPFSSAARWNLATPTIDWTDKNQTYNDPLTGTQLRPLTFPGTVGALWNERPFATDFYVPRAGNWTNPANVINGSLTTFATSNSPGATIFAGVDPTNAYKCALSGYLSDCSVDDIGFRLIAKSTSSNMVVGVCRSMDSGLTCLGDEIQIPLTTTMTDYGVKFGRSPVPLPTAAGWGSVPMERQYLPRKGYGTMDRGAVTLTHDHFAMDDLPTPHPENHLIAGATGTGMVPNQPGEFHSFASYFDPAIPPGPKVMIAGSSPVCVRNLCTVSSISNATTMKIAETLTSAAGPPAGLITWVNFGLRLRVLSGSGTVSATLAKYAIATSLQRKLPASGATDQWQRIKVTAGDGKHGFFGVIRDTANAFSTLHFLTTEEGEQRTLGVFKPPATIAGYPAGDNPSGGGGGPAPDVAVFDRTVPGRAILFWPQQGTTGQVASFFAAQYDIAGCGIQNVLGYQYFKTTNPTDGYNNFSYPSEQPCITWTNLTRQSQGRDLTSQINAITPGWCDLQGMTSAQCTARFPGLTYFGVVGDYLMLYRALSTQDSPHALFVFDKFGTFSRVIKSWNTGLSSSISPRIATMGIHTLEQTGLPNTAALYTNKFPGFASGQPYAGPFLAPVLGVYRSGGALDTTSTALPPTKDGSYDSGCPANSYGATDCISFRTKAVLCHAGSVQSEIDESKCPWDNNQSTLPGGQAIHADDTLIDQDTGTTEAERFIVLQVIPVGAQPGNVDIIAGRHAAKSYCEKNNQTPQQKTHPNGWRVAWGIHLNGCDNGLIHVALDTGTVLESPRVDIGGHFDLGEGDTAGTFNMWTSGQGAGDGVSNNLPVASIVNPQTHIAVPLWNGIGNDANGYLQGKIQAYPSIRGATGANVRLDYKHANPGFGATDAPANSIDDVTALLQPGTKSVYKVSIIGYPGAAVATYKNAPLQMWAGPWLVRDHSSPTMGNTITDATPWDGCLAYRAGECRSGSAAGDLYMSVPNADLTGSANVAAFGRRTPSAIWAVSHMGWIIESKMNENAGDKTRRITMALSFPGWSEAFSNARIVPDGSGLVFHLQSAGSQRQMMWAKLGARTQTYTTSRITWQPVTIPVAANAAYPQARVAFGYTEYGSISDHFCMPRQETCIADEITTPYAFAHQAGWKACSTTAGCTVTVNAPPGRMLYYRVERGSGGVLQVREPILAKAVN